ncbi:MAG: cytochrome c3 family protein [Longimicrobiales bacterium]
MGRSRWLVVGVVAALAVAAAAVYAVMQGPLGTGKGPDQPIAFPHDLHAGTNRIPCMYCHTSADRSVDAGIPSLQVCAGCHLGPGGVPIVRADRPGVQQLAAYWREQRPIPWVRIYDLPDHVHFPHLRHVKAGVQCQECHGPVETMREVRREASLQMGWCLNCHKARNARIDCSVCHY